MKKKSRKLSKTIIIFVLVLVCFSARADLFASADSYFHCWSCGGGEWSMSKTPDCPECGWNICPNCGACSKGCERTKVPFKEELPDFLRGLAGMLAFPFGFWVVSTINDKISYKKNEKELARIKAENANKPKQTNSYSNYRHYRCSIPSNSWKEAADITPGSNAKYVSSTPTAVRSNYMQHKSEKPQASYPYDFKKGNVLTHISFGKCRVVQVNEKIIQMQVISTGEQKKFLNDPSVAKFFEPMRR